MTWKMPFKKETKEKNQMQLQKDSLTLLFLVYMKDLQIKLNSTIYQVRGHWGEWQEPLEN